MKVDLVRVRTACEKCDNEEYLQRHHTGCQKMFVRHFERRAGQAKYDEFVARYWSFNRDDIRVLCKDCHKRLHLLYMPIIGRACWKIKKPMSRWSWRQAEILMRDLAEYCEKWLAIPNVPGTLDR